MVTETVIPTLGEFTAYIETISVSDNVTWFRGTGNKDYKLLPSLYRHPTINDAGTLIAQEQEILSRFKQRSYPYLTRTPADDWDFFFIMQHFGVPTRLLDWSENPFVALYFALTSVARDSATGAPTNDVAIWVLDPKMWNKKALEQISLEDILAPDDPLMTVYKPSDSRMRSNTVTIFGNYNSTRIVAQKGAFVLFGKKMDPMEDVFVTDSYPNECLQKLVVPVTSVVPMMKSLTKIGITDSVIFPDLEGLAKEIKRRYNYL